MDTEQFWQIVADAQGSASQLQQILLNYTKAEIIAFDEFLDEAMYLLDRKDIHAITDGSDDGFEYVRLWIVSQGREYVEAVLQDPAKAPHYEDEEQENELFGYAARKAYEEKWGEEMPFCESKRGTGTNREGWL